MQSRVKASGAIGETSELFSVVIADGDELIIDMSDVTMISSHGVKNWILWTQTFPANYKLELEKCPFLIVNQVITVARFLPKSATITSFFAPYDCENCGSEIQYLLNRGVDYQYPSADKTQKAKIMIPPELPCDKCGKELQPAFSIAKAFLFLG